MSDIKRECALCKQDQTPTGGGLTAVSNPKGGCVGLVCQTCYLDARALVDRLAQRYGAYFVDGVQQCSPRGTPDVRSFGALRKMLATNEEAASVRTSVMGG